MVRFMIDVQDAHESVVCLLKIVCVSIASSTLLNWWAAISQHIWDSLRRLPQGDLRIYTEL